jgi:hypothetical protein
MLPLCQKHVWVLVVATIHLILEHLIKIFIHVIVLERWSYLLVSLVSLFPLTNLRDQTSSRVLIPGLGIILFLGDRLVSQEHSFHQFLHYLHHQVKLVL